MVNRWWYDEVKAANLEQAKQDDVSLTEADTEPEQPGFLAAFLVLAGLVLIGYFVFRRVWQPRGL